MKAKRILPLLAAASLLVSFGAQANDIEPGKEYYTAIKTRTPIVIDGNLSEWGPAQLLADPRFSTPKYSGTNNPPGTLVFFEEYDGGTWTGPDDQTSAVQVVYDDDNVYFGFVVTDDFHENAALSAWNGDSVQLMIANEARDTQIALYNYALGGVEGALGDVIIMHEAGPGGTDAVVTRNSATKRTIYEIKLPKASLGLETLEGGVRFGLGMAINDGDELTPGQKGWGGLGAHSIVFGKTPAETALVSLARINDIESGKEFYFANPAPRAIALDGVLSEWSGVPVLSDPRFHTPKYSATNNPPGTLVLFEEYDGGTWTGPDDQTSAVQIVYDADNIYFGFVVTDEYHENAANSAWNGDSIQLMIADADQATQVALYNYALNGVEGALGDVQVMHEAGPGGTEAVITRNATTKRTTYEIKLPKASLALESLDLGTQFGLGMAINDGDELTPGQKGWGGLGAHSIVFGKTPSETALVTLGIGGVGSDQIFFSAINPSILNFTFRVNDKGDSILDPATVKLWIDDVEVPLVAGVKNIDATDFSYTPTQPMDPGAHTYTIEATDTNGTTVTDSSNFSLTYGDITPFMKAVSFDNTKPGFIFKIWQNETYVPNSLAKAEEALASQLTDASGNPVTVNNAYADEQGPALAAGVVDVPGKLLRYEIPTVINLNQGINASPAEAEAGYFTSTTTLPIPDNQMPGVPGETLSSDGISAEIITFVDLPQGWVKLGVRSDDSVKVQAGYINNPVDGLLLGQVDGNTADITLTLRVQEAGVYPIRVVYQEATGGAHLELFSFLADGITRVLLNDTANGGLRTYSTGVAPDKSTTVLPEFTDWVRNANGSITIEWTGGRLQSVSAVGSQWQNVAGATSPYTVTPGATPAAFYRVAQ